ncbi:hypothetical protein BST83_12160 [Polaribacter filamentus]|uniref:Glycosyltransferase n=1 Tax=Polaribacter filamentus TaxID=53483 RepID=A0A2S7KYS3_9FLAO|nr:hypothetical protein [Polaribacter filamentus]PQB07822.1 hypothetical protein BST83_12160 [Polaribacter filamentus]
MFFISFYIVFKIVMIRHLIIKNKLINYLICYLLRIRNKKALFLIQKNKIEEIFNFRKISSPLGKYYNELIFDNNFFGLGYSLKTYCDLKQLNAYVEHGYFFGSYVPDDEKNWWCKKIITFSRHREEFIKKKTDKEVIKIGPYIHYAEDYMVNADFDNLKNDLGKMLLVFPAHAATGAKIDFDTNLLIANINSVKNDFDTVVISLFWDQAQDKKITSVYKKEGYKIFSAGHRYDWYFLSRLKTMIKLSDYTMSNGVGTQLGYCIYLNKPHWIAKQKVTEVAFNSKGEENNSTYTNEEYIIVSQEINEVEEVFKTYLKIISKKQKELVNKYWGIDEVKSKKELFKLLK